MKMFFALGVAFEIPVATFLLVRSGQRLNAAQIRPRTGRIPSAAPWCGRTVRVQSLSTVSLADSMGSTLGTRRPEGISTLQESLAVWC